VILLHFGHVDKRTYFISSHKKRLSWPHPLCIQVCSFKCRHFCIFFNLLMVLHAADDKEARFLQFYSDCNYQIITLFIVFYRVMNSSSLPVKVSLRCSFYTHHATDLLLINIICLEAFHFVFFLFSFEEENKLQSGLHKQTQYLTLNILNFDSVLLVCTSLYSL